MKPQKNQKLKRSQRDYTLGFKLSVVSSVEKGDMTYKQAQRVYGIQGRSTVLVWLRKHGTLDWSNPKLLTMTQPKRKETPTQTIKRLEKEIADLKALNSINQEVIRIVDQQTGSDYKKKYLAKLSEVSKKKKR